MIELPRRIEIALQSDAIRHYPHNTLRYQEWKSLAETLYQNHRDADHPEIGRPVDVLNEMVHYVPNSGIPSDQIPAYAKILWLLDII